MNIKPIKTEADYQFALAKVSELMDAEISIRNLFAIYSQSIRNLKTISILTVQSISFSIRNLFAIYSQSNIPDCNEFGGD